MIKNILTALTISCLPLCAAAIKEKSPFSLSLDEIKQGSSTTGLLNLPVILNLAVGNKLQITLVNGQTYLFLITSTEISDIEESIRLYGECLNKDNCNVGFVFTKKGDIAGAIVNRKDKQTYAIRFNTAINGFIFEPYLEQLKIQ